MKKGRRLFSSLMGLFLGIGIFSYFSIANKDNVEVKADTQAAIGTYLYIEDQAGKGWTNDGVDPVAHLYNITFVEGSGYSKTLDVKPNSFGFSLTTGADYLDVKMSWVNGGDNRPYEVTIPWYISSFSVCFYAKENGTSRYLYQEGNSDPLSFTCSAGNIIKFYSGSWDGYGAWWDGSKYRSKISLSIKNDFTYEENKYNVSVSCSNNGTVNDCSGTYLKGQRLILLATPKQGFTFDCWKLNNSIVSTYENFLSEPINENSNFVASFYKPYNPGRYLIESDNNLNNAIFFSDSTSGKPSKTIFLEKGKSFKLAWVTEKGAIDNYSGYDAINVNDSDALSCLSTNSQSDIIVDFTARYVINYDYNGGKLEIDLSKESYDANQLAAKVYSFTKYFGEAEQYGNGSGYCVNSDRYPAMRSIFENLSSEEKTAFKAMADTNEGVRRYIAWAIANNDTNNVLYEGWMTPDVLNKAYYGSYYVDKNSLSQLNDADSIALITAVAAIASGALLGIYVFKRKKHE